MIEKVIRHTHQHLVLRRFHHVMRQRNIVILGDSISHDLRGPSNFARHGMHSAELIERLPNHQEAIDSADIVLMMIGVNDLLLRMSAADLCANVHTLAERIQTPILWTLVMPAPVPSWELAMVNHTIRSLVGVHRHVWTLDMAPVLQKSPRYFRPDGIHLSPQGYQAWTRSLMASMWVATPALAVTN